jgi:putative spermidine/putrescine transport system permease protein
MGDALAGDHRRVTRRRLPYLLVALPTGFLSLFFVLPNVLLLSASLLSSEDGMVPDGGPTLDNFATLLGSRLYLNAILRTFQVGFAVGLLVVVISYPIAYWLVRMTSRWKNLLVALALAPLLASVIVRTYGWWVLFNRDGAINVFLLGTGMIAQPLALLPSRGAIIVGLAHALLPYGILTLMASLNAVNPSLERAAMSLGAGRLRTFREVTLPLTAPGIAAGFLLSFAISISAYATPAILGGAALPMMGTLIRNLFAQLLNWTLGSALGVVLVASSALLFVLMSLLGRRRMAT